MHAFCISGAEANFLGTIEDSMLRALANLRVETGARDGILSEVFTAEAGDKRA